jgi:N-acetylmuramoyl-L-alanine amidase
LNALRLIGYDVKDSTAAIRAFRLHFMQDTITVLDEPAQKILFSLSTKF